MEHSVRISEHCRRHAFRDARQRPLPNEERPIQGLPIAPDLAVDVISPNDTAHKVNEKIEE
jgi:Uma2 family endonuclease